MGRPVILGNGTLTVGLDEHGLVHDFYYPYVGLENLTTSRSTHHKIGIWVNDSFSWVDDGTWHTEVNFCDDSLVSRITMRSDVMHIELELHDFVDSQSNTFCRRITVHNHAETTREIRVFMHQVFQISRGGRADTAIYVPEEHYILDYKGRCSLLISGQSKSGKAYDQFAIGNYGIEGKEGTFRDAEDGQLSGSAVEHGGVDSVIRFSEEILANSSETIDYWIIAADSQYTAEKIHAHIKHNGLDSLKQRTEQYWHHWLSTGSNVMHSVAKEHLGPLKKSLMVIKAHADKRGGIIASADSSIYNYGRDYYSYVWPRDGAFAIWPLIRLGFTDEPKRFFGFCRDILTPDGYLMHKYQPDRAIGSTWHPWLHGNRTELPIQEDETAIVIYMLGEYFEYSKDEDFVRNLYDTLVQPAANFMCEFIDQETGLPHASYDLWEEKFMTHTYTVAVVYQALLVAADFAEKFDFPDDAVRWNETAEVILHNAAILFDEERKSFRKGYLLQQDGSLQFDNTIDVSSLYGAMMFGLYKQPDNLVSSIHAIETILLNNSPSDGSPRYEHDHYFETDPRYMGNPWFVTTLWIAQYYARTNQIDKSKHYLDWTIQKALPSGILSEQVHPINGTPISVTPLVWSHAEVVNTILDITKLNELTAHDELGG